MVKYSQFKMLAAISTIAHLQRIRPPHLLLFIVIQMFKLIVLYPVSHMVVDQSDLLFTGSFAFRTSS